MRREHCSLPPRRKVIAISEKKRFEYKISLAKDWQGKLIRKSFYSTKSRADAKRKAERYRAHYDLELLCGGEPIKSRTLFKNWAIQCLEKYKRPFVKGNTYNGTYYQPVISRLIPYFGDAALEDILPIHVQEYVNKMARVYKPETVKKDFTVFSFIMQNACDNGLCRANPAAKSIRLPKIERADKTAYTREQYGKVYEFAKTYPNGLSIMLLLETGISRSELLGLTWDDFDGDNGVVHINQGLVAYQDADKNWITETDGLKNSYRRRAVPIVDPELLKRLKEKPRRISINQGTTFVDTTHIFHSPEGKPYQPNNWNNRVFIPFMKAMHKRYPDIPILSAHELRHTAATRMIRSGIPPLLVARILGHCDTKMLVKIYDHTDVGTLRKALERTRNM